jgi:dipeptidyl aminopeptidase/acylaminoacyl peptidase
MQHFKKTTKEQPVTFRNKRGRQLSGVLHLPGQEKKAPVIIMAHGFTDDKTGDNRLFVKFGRYAARHGFAVLRFDFAGSGDSEGDFSDITIGGEIDDLSCAIDFVYALPQVDWENIHIIGYSLGGTVSIIVTAKDKRVRSLSAWAPAVFLPDVFKRVLGEKVFLFTSGKKKIACDNGNKQFWLNSNFLRSLAQHDLRTHVKNVTPRHIFLAQGTLDKKVLPKETRRLFDAAFGPKKILFIKNAGHSFAYFEKELFGWTLKNIRERRG